MLFGQCKSMVHEHSRGLGEALGAPSTLNNPPWEEEEHEVGLEVSYLNQAVGARLDVRHQCLRAPQGVQATCPALPWHIKTVNGWNL